MSHPIVFPHGEGGSAASTPLRNTTSRRATAAGVTPGIRCAWPMESGRTRTSLSRTSADRPGTVSNGNADGKRISSYFLRFFASSSCRRIYPSYLMDSSACSTASRVAARSSGSQARSIAPVTPGRRNASA